MTEKRTSVALGYFDGLHIAHRQVLSAALEQKQNGLAPTVLLFDRHPYEVLTGRQVERLQTEEDRRARLLAMGFSVLDISFESVRDLTPSAFAEEILAGRLAAGFVSCGFNYTFGRGGRGDASLLRRLCSEYGIGLRVCPEVLLDGQAVSSTAIRAALKNGDPALAAAMLGEPFAFSSPVFHGDERGRLLDAPTANQSIPAALVTPKFGVYVTRVELPDGRRFPGVTNIGCRPTFNGGSVRSETCLLGFSGNLYGQTLRISLLAFLREEKKFDSFEALKAQIAQDAAAARSVYAEDRFAE